MTYSKTVNYPKPHIITKTLASGRVTRYAYAFRGGPRVSVPPEHPLFESERKSLIEQFRRDEGVKIARARVLQEEGRVFSELTHKLAKNARHRAARRKLPCDISASTIADLIERQGHRCAVSGLKFDLAFNLARAHSRNMYGPSLDRISNSKGYVKGNVRLVIAAVNYAINEWGYDEYLKICHAIVKFQDAKSG